MRPDFSQAVELAEHCRQNRATLEQALAMAELLRVEIRLTAEEMRATRKQVVANLEQVKEQLVQIDRIAERRQEVWRGGPAL